MSTSYFECNALVSGTDTDTATQRRSKTRAGRFNCELDRADVWGCVLCMALDPVLPDIQK